MNKTDPVEQIADALNRLRWRGGASHRGGYERPGRAAHRDMHGGHGVRNSHGVPDVRGEGHGGNPSSHGRGSGGPALGRLLWTLASTREALSVSDIAQLVGVDQPRASRLVAQGVELGLLRREADPEDARRTRIVLTEQGEAMVLRMRVERGGAVREALASFSEVEREQLAQLLTRFAAAWSNGPRSRR